MDKRERILIIDDDWAHLEMAKAIIDEHFHVMLAASGAEALDILRAGAIPDLILLDIDMPDMDGYAAYNVLREMEPLADTPVIFLTGLTDSEAELNGLKLGAQDYVTKPFVKDNLLARIHLRIEEARRFRQMRDRLNGAGIDEERFAACADRLTAAECEVARLIVIGCGNQEIAQRLNYTAGYVKNLVTLVYEKLDVHSRSELRAMFRK